MEIKLRYANIICVKILFINLYLEASKVIFRIRPDDIGYVGGSQAKGQPG